MIALSWDIWHEMVAHSMVELPNEACGLLVGHPDGRVVAFHPCRNAAESSKLYTLDPRDHLRIDRAADDAGLAVIGVVHSHTHTDAYPSPTDVNQAPDPDWHYVIVSLRHPDPAVRSYRIIDGVASEEAITGTDAP